MRKQKSWNKNKPRANPNDNRYTTKVINHKKKKESKEFCKKFDSKNYEI